MADVFGKQEIDAPRQLGEGQALCQFCQGRYSVLLEVVCDDCKRLLCPLCATWSHRNYRCPECKPTGTFVAPDGV